MYFVCFMALGGISRGISLNGNEQQHTAPSVVSLYMHTFGTFHRPAHDHHIHIPEPSLDSTWRNACCIWGWSDVRRALDAFANLRDRLGLFASMLGCEQWADTSSEFSRASK